MESDLRFSGIDVVGEVPWGTALCHFYDSTQDLFDVTIPFLQAGLAAGERCVWLVSSPLEPSRAWDALSPVIHDLPLHRERGDIDIRDAREWYRINGGFQPGQLGQVWDRQVQDALSGGYSGLRVSHDTSWLEGSDRHAFYGHEKSSDGLVDRRMVALSTYPVAACNAKDLLDVMRTRHVAISRWGGEWDVLERRSHDGHELSPILRADPGEPEHDGNGSYHAPKNHFPEIVGRSAALRVVLEEVRRIAPTDVAVLITGESGSGKELVARAIHAASARCRRDMITVNCASIPRELFESEFFGHVKGAFTGAVRDRIGRFEMADRGTIFLDEVGEIPLELQSKLLRVLQEGRFERVGEDRTRQVNVRLLAASNRDLRGEVEAGRFRLDLYYRLCVFPIELPPLRARPEDIAPLARHFFRDISRRMDRSDVSLDEKDLETLVHYDWPGNVRELHHVMERAVVLAPPGGPIRLAQFMAPKVAGSTTPGSNGATHGSDVVPEVEMRARERSNLVSALERAGWRIYGATGAAALLGLKPTTLASRLKRLGILRPGRLSSRSSRSTAGSLPQAERAAATGL